MVARTISVSVNRGDRILAEEHAALLRQRRELLFCMKTLSGKKHAGLRESLSPFTVEKILVQVY